MVYFTIVASFLLSSQAQRPCPPLRPHEESHRGLTQTEILKIVSDFERIINMNPPSNCDYRYLFQADESATAEINAWEKYCEIVLKAKSDSKECNAAWSEKRSLYLLNIKNLLTDGKDIPIKIYVSPKIESCMISGLLGIAVTGPGTFKYIQLIIPCDISEAYNYNMISEIKINGKLAGEYPFTITKPLPPIK